VGENDPRIKAKIGKKIFIIVFKIGQKKRMDEYR
jgi:hypothetical protein